VKFQISLTSKRTTEMSKTTNAFLYSKKARKTSSSTKTKNTTLSHHFQLTSLVFYQIRSSNWLCYTFDKYLRFLEFTQREWSVLVVHQIGKDRQGFFGFLKTLFGYLLQRRYHFLWTWYQSQDLLIMVLFENLSTFIRFNYHFP